MASEQIATDIRYLAENHPGYLEQVQRNYWRNFALYILEGCFFSFGFAIFASDTILPYLVSELTGNPFLIGLVPALNFLGYYLPQLFSAYFSQKLSRRKGMVITVAVVQRTTLLLITLAVQTIFHLPEPLPLLLFFTAYSLFCFSNGFITPPYTDLVNKTIISRRGLFYGLQIAGSSLAGFAGSMIARQMLDNLAFPANFQQLFWVGFLVSLFSPIVMLFYREQPYPEPHPVEPLGNFFKVIPAKLRTYPLFTRVLVARGLVGLSFMATGFYAVYAVNHYNLNPGTVAVFTMVSLLTRSVMGLVWGAVGDRHGYRLVLACLAGMLAVQSFLAMAVPDARVFYIVMMLTGAINAALYVADPNLVFETTPPAETSRFIGISNTVLGPLMALAPLVGGLLVNYFDYQALFGAAMIFGLIGLIYVLLKVEEPRRLNGLIKPE